MGKPSHWTVEHFLRVFAEVLHFPLSEASEIIHEVSGSRSSPVIIVRYPKVPPELFVLAANKKWQWIIKGVKIYWDFVRVPRKYASWCEVCRLPHTMKACPFANGKVDEIVIKERHDQKVPEVITREVQMWQMAPIQRPTPRLNEEAQNPTPQKKTSNAPRQLDMGGGNERRSQETVVEPKVSSELETNPETPPSPTTLKIIEEMINEEACDSESKDVLTDSPIREKKREEPISEPESEGEATCRYALRRDVGPSRAKGISDGNNHATNAEDNNLSDNEIVITRTTRREIVEIHNRVMSWDCNPEEYDGTSQKAHIDHVVDGAEGKVTRTATPPLEVQGRNPIIPVRDKAKSAPKKRSNTPRSNRGTALKGGSGFSDSQ